MTKLKYQDWLEEPNKYNSFVDVFLMREILAHYKIRNIKLLKELIAYLSNFIGRRFSYNQAAKELKASINTIREYISILEQAGFFILVYEFSAKKKKNSTSQCKIYLKDLALTEALYEANCKTLLEHRVLLKLQERKLPVSYHKLKQECDFLIERNSQIELFQVVSKLTSINKTEHSAEAQGLIEAGNLYKTKSLMILSPEEQELSIKTNSGDIRIANLDKWLNHSLKSV